MSVLNMAMSVHSDVIILWVLTDVFVLMGTSWLLMANIAEVRFHV